MRKRMLAATPLPGTEADTKWLDVTSIAEAELTSEDSDHPIENALGSAGNAGWRASEPGPQTIRLTFDRPQAVGRIRLRFLNGDGERTQEFVLRYSADGGKSFQEIVRQQWNFSPDGSDSELEDYRVDLTDVSALELAITPNLGGGPDRATLAEWRIG